MTLTTKIITVNGKQTVVIGTPCGKREAKENGFDCGKKSAYVVACNNITAYGYDFDDAFNYLTQKFMRAI